MTKRTPADLEWSEDMDAAPRYCRIWVLFGGNTRNGPWIRIAQRIGDNWVFDSNQVNMWMAGAAFIPDGRDWHHMAKQRVISAWAPLRYPEEQDPANLGKKPRVNIRDPETDA